MTQRVSDLAVGSRLGPALRTARTLRLRQGIAQLRHLLAPRASAPVTFNAAVPALSSRQIGVPFLPPPSHALSTRSGDTTTVRLLNREVSFRGDIDWDFAGEGPLWANQLHHFDHVRGPELTPDDRLALMLDWIEHHTAGAGWVGHPIAHRVLAWGKLLLTPGALPVQSLADAAPALRSSLGVQIETLSRNLEVRLQANHLFTNLLAVVFGGILLDGDCTQRWLARSEALRAELRDQVHPDGGHEERSPMYHALLLEQVLDLLNLAQTLPERVPSGLAEDLVDTASRMCGALEVWIHPDGEIALFSDSAFGIASRPAVLADYAAALGVPVFGPEQAGRLPYTGFVRLAEPSPGKQGPGKGGLATNGLDLIVSVAGPAPDHQPGHAHCDALSFELTVGGQRVVTDTGVFAYVSGPDRDCARTTRSHATLEVAGVEQAELWGAHRVGGRPDVRVLDYTPGRACEASCAGWSTRDAVHRRRFELEGGVLVMSDTLEGGARPVRLTLPLAPGLRARLEGDGDRPLRLRVLLSGEVELVVDLPLPAMETVDWRLEQSDYFPEFGRRERRWCLVGESESFTSGTWRFAASDARRESGG